MREKNSIYTAEAHLTVPLRHDVFIREKEFITDQTESMGGSVVSISHRFSDIDTYSVEGEQHFHQKLSAPLDTLFDSTPEISRAVRTRATNQLGRQGVKSIRDVLVVGSEYVNTTRNVGKDVKRFISEGIKNAGDPLMVWYEFPPAAMAARWCENLSQVHAGILTPWYSNYTVQDLIDDPKLVDRGDKDTLASVVEDFTIVRAQLAGAALRSS